MDGSGVMENGGKEWVKNREKLVRKRKVRVKRRIRLKGKVRCVVEMLKKFTSNATLVSFAVFL